MVVFLAPVAVAGYMYWKKKKTTGEEAAAGNESSAQQDEEWDIVAKDGESTEDSTASNEVASAVNAVIGESVSGESTTQPSQPPSENAEIDEQQSETPKASQPEEALGPLAQWKKFRTNLEKEFEKARVREKEEHDRLKALHWGKTKKMLESSTPTIEPCKT